MFHEIIEMDSGDIINEIVFEQLGEMYEKGLGEEYFLSAGTRGNTHKLHEFAIKGYTYKYKV